MNDSDWYKVHRHIRTGLFVLTLLSALICYSAWHQYNALYDAGVDGAGAHLVKSTGAAAVAGGAFAIGRWDAALGALTLSFTELVDSFSASSKKREWKQRLNELSDRSCLWFGIGIMAGVAAISYRYLVGPEP